MAEVTEGKQTGHAVIQSYLKTLTTQPGVYRMLDAEGRVLYVGKARNLRARVSTYARPSGHSARIARMIHATAAMMFLTTRTETEALLLEQNLIKQLKPHFNVLLRDDKSFPNILVSREHAFPQIKKHRGAKKERGAYYGPFASAGAVNRTLNQLQKVFLLRSCTDTVFASRTRPCLLYQIRRCAAPCVGHVDEAAYAALVADAERFLQGKTTQVQAALAAEMAAASEALEFERAAALRDRIRALTQIQQVQGINPRGVAEADVVALHMEGGQACVQVFFIRAHQSWGNRDFYPRTGAGAEAPEVLEAFLAQAVGRERDASWRRATDMLRLGYLGVPPIAPELYDHLETLGARVIFNETQRQFSLPSRSPDLVEKYLVYTYPYSIFYRLEDIGREVERRRLDGVIHYVQSFCFRQVEDIIIRRNLDVPVLTLELDRCGALDARTATRLESFVSMLEG
jgi:excinuclease UvrABC nuclease subunit